MSLKSKATASDTTKKEAKATDPEMMAEIAAIRLNVIWSFRGFFSFLSL
jgi:hypothetical protein